MRTEGPSPCLTMNAVAAGQTGDVSSARERGRFQEGRLLRKEVLPTLSSSLPGHLWVGVELALGTGSASPCGSWRGSGVAYALHAVFGLG